MNINKNKKFDILFQAIDKNNKLNENKAKAYTIINKDNVHYIVLDKNEELDGYELYNAIIKNFRNLAKKIDVDFDSFISFAKGFEERMIASLTSALEYASVVPWTAKTTKQNKCEFNIFGNEIKNYESLLKEYIVVAEAQTFTRSLQDKPSCMIYPSTFVKEVQNKFKDLKNVKIKVLDTDELIKKGMNLLVGVGKLATGEKSPKMMVLEYNNDKSSERKYGYVGKGVCFDAGGYNVKTGPNMRWMKFDMSGAAIVCGALYALAKNNIKTNVVAVTPLVLNLINENSQLPDDVITSYSGKTVEIDNTDAEGRLILADALTYAVKDLKATHLIDVATLTGAMIYSLGETFTGTWSSTDSFWNRVNSASKLVGEQLWRLPFHHEFLEMLTKSNVADIVNSCNGPAAGSSRAACFLKEFTNDVPYVHFDVAATADKGNEGTGVILRTLYATPKMPCSSKNK